MLIERSVPGGTVRLGVGPLWAGGEHGKCAARNLGDKRELEH